MLLFIGYGITTLINLVYCYRHPVYFIVTVLWGGGSKLMLFARCGQNYTPSLIYCYNVKWIESTSKFMLLLDMGITTHLV